MYNPAWQNWNVVYHRAQYWAQCCLPHIFVLLVTFAKIWCAIPLLCRRYTTLFSINNSRLGSIEECIYEIQHWMNTNFVKLNADKTGMIILSSPYFAKAQTHDMIINLNGEIIHPNKADRNPGVIFDNAMNMESHVNKITQTAYLYLRNIEKIRHFVTNGACESLLHASIISRLDSVMPYYMALQNFL